MTGLSRVALLEVPSVPSVCPVVEMDYSTALAFGSDLYACQIARSKLVRDIAGKHYCVPAACNPLSQREILSSKGR